MLTKLNNKVLFIDFDSTFAQIETIDEIAKIALDNDPNKSKKINLINEITKNAMSGKISFSKALYDRLNILTIKSHHIKLAIEMITKRISNSIKRNKDFIKLNANNIWIISGGFTQIICPCVIDYGIKPENVIANTLIINSGIVKGIDTKNPMSMDRGKIKAIKSLQINLESIMIGDGYTDYEVYQEEASDHFIYFSENILRPEVSNKSKLIANSFEDVIDIIAKIK
tara:strand:- start:20 stop:700 length:681 start_codon:yes stop_codon:yes gene_type:complete